MHQVLDLYANLLSERLDSGAFMTEDFVRYTFFHALLSSEFCSHIDVVLELPHPALGGKEIDTVIHGFGSRPSTAFEFKYHRRIPGGKNQPCTEHAGDCFNDIFRLAGLPEPTAHLRYFVYLTDDEMASYLTQPKNGLAGWFDLPEGRPFAVTNDLVTGRAKSFQGRIKAEPIQCTTTCLMSRELPLSHSLRIYQIET